MRIWKERKDCWIKWRRESLYVRTDFEAGGRRGCLLATTDLSDHNALLECLRALREAGKKITGYDVLQTKVLTTFERTFVETEEEALGYLLSGDGLIFLDGEPAVSALPCANTKRAPFPSRRRRA